jgi:hypothetical protein
MSGDIQYGESFMANMVMAVIALLEGFSRSSIRQRHGGSEDLGQDAQDLLLAQGLVALILLFAGGVKLVVPLDGLAEHIPLPGMLVRFMGVAETLGAMLLARFLRIRAL